MTIKKMRPEDVFFDIPGLPTPPAPAGPSIKVIHPSITNKKSFVAEPGAQYIMANSGAKDWSTKHDLSPFYLGPCKLYGDHVSKNMENGWQFSKVFPEHIGTDGNPTSDYWTWAKEGWSRQKAAVDMVKDKSNRQSYFLWEGRKLNKIEARKTIYVPLYAERVTRLANRTFEDLKTRWLMMKIKKAGTIYLMEFDCYDYTGKTLTEVLNNPKKTMGHGYVLAMLLLKDPALKECELRPGTLDRL